MIDEIDGYYLLTLGFAKAWIANPEQTLKQLRAIDNRLEVQLVKADLIAGPEHLQFAARNALHSYKSQRRRSKSLAVELLLYLSCQRQIVKAIRFLGIDSEDSQVVLIAISDSKDAVQELDRQASRILRGEEDMNLIEVQSKQKIARLQRSYGITNREFRAARFEGETDSSLLKRLVIERSTLLDVEG